MKTLVDITKEDVKRRCFAALAVVILLFGGLSARLAYLQLMDYEEMRNQVLDQYSSTMTLPASRGSIYDRNMQPLAISETVETVFISPMGIMKADEADTEKEDNYYRDLIINGLSELLDVERSVISKACEKTNSQYQVIKKNVDEETADEVRQFIIDNQLYTMMNLEEDSKRYYEHGDLAAHVIGFNGMDKGLSGLELYYDEYLAGTDGL
ncbi:MAG: hypothetical protein IJN86_02970, partial [Clostridia bacterium]|nr:hypothetical protein [Clostridia bacterium]